MSRTMSRRGKNNKFNGNSNNHTFFDKDYGVPKDDCAVLTPEVKEF